MAQTGNSATIVFGTSGFTASYSRIGGTGMGRESLDVSHLGTADYMSFQPADLVDGGEFSWPDLLNGEIMSGEYTVKWGGQPTYTAGS